MNRSTFIRLSKEKYGDAFKYDHLPEFIRRVAEIIICKKHGKLEMIPRDHLRSKHGCPHCAYEYSCKTSHEYSEQTIQKAKNKYGNKFNYSEVDKESEKGQRVKITCSIHGVFEMSLHRHLHSVTGCVMCGRVYGAAKNTKYKTIDCIKSVMKNIHGDKYEYLNYTNANRELTYRCPRHDTIFTQKMDIHLSGRGCRHCYFDSFRITPEEFLQRVKLVHPEGYMYDLAELKTVNHKITIKHTCGRVYLGRVSNHLSGQGCSRCRSSLGEAKIRKFLEINQIEFIDQFKINGYRFRYDFCLPELRILIEYDGEQHSIPIEYFGGLPALEIRKELDRQKTWIAEANEYALIRISYTRFDSLEVHLSRALDNYFNYRVSNVFYRNAVELCEALKLPGSTLVRELEQHRTFKVLKPT